jgi:glycosyltransferase involved in cell wall biosynthesis
VVIDFDDPWHLRYATHGNPLVRTLLGGKLETVAARAPAVTTGSPGLRDWARSAKAPYVIELPPAVDIDRYPVLPLPEGPFTIGWIGTPRNEDYLKVIAEPLRRLHDVYGARVRVIGGGGSLSIPGVAIDQVPWREDTEVTELAACHVGVMPLLDGPWERGKCGYKVIQYVAAGRAAVASVVGASKSIVVPGQTGFLAGDTQEWVAALGALAADRERARTMGMEARQRAEALYSLPVSAAKLVEALRAALTGRARENC